MAPRLEPVISRRTGGRRLAMGQTACRNLGFGKVPTLLPCPRYIHGSRLGPDGRSVAIWGNEGVIRVIDPNSGDEVMTLADPKRVLGRRVDPSADRLVVCPSMDRPDLGHHP